MLSNRITAKRRELNPTSHANDSVTNDIRLFQPPGLNIEDPMSVLMPASAMFVVLAHVSINEPIA